MLLGRPTHRMAVALYRTGVYHLDFCIQCKIPIDGFLQVQDDGCIRFRESISLNTAPLCGCQLYINIIILQPYPVITCRGRLVIVRESRIDSQWGRCLAIGVCHRHKRNVIQIACTGTRQVGMAEACDGRIGIVIASDAIPPRQSIVRTQLHHTERYLCTRISVSCKVCSNHRVGILYQSRLHVAALR